jgi:hypothetical protein
MAVDQQPRQGPGTFVPGTPQDVSPVPSVGLLTVKGNAQLDAEERLRKQQAAMLEDKGVASDLASFIEDRYQEAWNAKRDITDEIMDAMRRREGIYSAEHLAEIKKQGGSEIFVQVTEVKCNAGEAWMGDVALPSEGRPWTATPTPMPELPPQIHEQIIAAALQKFEGQGAAVSEESVKEFVETLQDEITRGIDDEAKERAENMSLLIDDEFTEGGFLDALEEGISDVVTTGTMILKGPFIEMETQLKWVEEDEWTPDVATVPKMKFGRVDPLKFFPSPGATGTDQAHASYLIELDEFTRTALLEMVGIEGYSEQNIKLVLEQNKDGVTQPLDTNSEAATIAKRSGSGLQDNPDQKFQGKWYCGAIDGWRLAEFGLTGLDSDASYEAVALKVGNYMIHARLNADPLGRRNYSRSIYKPRTGSFWGRGVPKLMAATQDACNAVARHLINNVAIASGPQAVIKEIEDLAEGESVDAIVPWRIWQFNDSTNTRKSPIDFKQPQMNAEILMAVFRMFLDRADEETGIPKYAYGSGEAGGAGKTATGLAMLMNSAARVLKKSILYVDKYIIRPMVVRAFNWNMLYVDDPNIKGDVIITAAGAMGLFVKEQQQIRLQEFLGQTNNPTDLEIIGKPGRAVLLRKSASGIGVPAEEVVPSKKEMQARLDAEKAEIAAQAAAASPGGAPGGGGVMPPAPGSAPVRPPVPARPPVPTVEAGLVPA